MTRPKRPDITIGAANIEDWKHPDLSRLLHCDVLNLQQARKAGRYLRRLPDYRVKGYRFSLEARGIKTLVDVDWPVRKRKPLEMREPWTGPKAGIPHAPRDYLALDLGVPWVVNIHAPTENSPKAQDETWDRIARFVKHHPHRPLFFAGDFNDRGIDQVQRLAERTDGRFVKLGSVDGILYYRARLIDHEGYLAPNGAHGWGWASFDY